MKYTTEKSLGQGLSSNFITFSSGIGVTGQVSCEVTWSAILPLATNPQNVPKAHARWILPNDCPIRKRHNAEYSNFGMLWADIDNPPSEGISAVIGALRSSTPFLIYTTKSATFDMQKCRVLIPLLQTVDFETWLLNQNNLNKVLGKAGIEADPCSLNPAQILFLPNRGAHYNHKVHRGLFEAKVSAVATHHTPTMALHKPTQSRATQASGSPIDRFKSAYSVADILQQARYIQHPHDPLRWRHPASESGSYSATINHSTGRVHTLSSCDPLDRKSTRLNSSH